MTKIVKRFSVRSLLLAVVAVAISLALLVPAYQRATAPVLTDRRGKTVISNTTFPVVSMRVFLSGDPSDRARILLLHRRTKEVPSKQWLPNWFEPKQTADGLPILGDVPRYLMINGASLYPRPDSSIAVVYASDNDAPDTIWVPYSKYSVLPCDDTNALWKNLVDNAE